VFCGRQVNAVAKWSGTVADAVQTLISAAPLHPSKGTIYPRDLPFPSHHYLHMPASSSR
jgi:hypothetical protein